MLGWALFFAVLVTLAVALILLWRAPLRLEIAYDSAEAPFRATLVFGIGTRTWPAVKRELDLTSLVRSEPRPQKAPEGVWEWLLAFGRLSTELARFLLVLGRRRRWPVGGELRGRITAAILGGSRRLHPRVPAFRWWTEVGAGDAGLTATAAGLVWAAKSLTMAYTLPHLTLLVQPELTVVPRFDQAAFRTVFYCILVVTAGDIIRVTVRELQQLRRRRHAARRG